jgi:hypothetical protein
MAVVEGQEEVEVVGKMWFFFFGGRWLPPQ